MTLDEIKLRRLHGQHLLNPAGYEKVIHDLCGVQAQFLSNAFHSLDIRSNDFDPRNTSKLVKSWSIRGTVHVFAKDDLPLFLHEGRTHYLRPCDTLEADEHISKQRKEYFAGLIIDSVAEGKATREELRLLCREKGMTESEEESVFNSWGGTLRALCESGRLCNVVQEKKAFQLCSEFEPMDELSARLEMARRYFKNLGPATIRDAAYFFGITQAQVKKWLSALDVRSFDFDGKTYFYIDRDTSNLSDMPDCIFLAGFDQLMLAYRKEENPFLPNEYLRNIFSLSGIVMPSLLLHGRVVGKWKKSGGTVCVTAFEPLLAEDRKCISDHAAALWPEVSKITFE